MELRKIDCHVHIVGDGSSGSDCWFELPGLWKKFLGRVMLNGVNVPSRALTTGMDSLYAESLVRQIRESSLDAVVALAQDLPYDAHGNPLRKDAQFYVSNDYVAGLAATHPELIPACSIHPGRPDAMDELEKCIALKMPVLKLLPNCLNVDYRDTRYIRFWQRMAEVGMILLTHTGGELTVKVFDPAYGDPKFLEIPLQCGVRVIAAHSAGRSGLFDPDWTRDLLEMFARFPNLYGDNSALCSINRARTLKHLLSPDVQQRIIHGSDYPVPVSGLGPWLMGHMSWRDHCSAGKIPNVIERDYQLKLSIGFNAQTFTRMDELLQQSAN